MAGRRGRAIYYTPEWDALRTAARQRAGWRCERCGGYGREVHHRIPLHAGGPALPDLDGVVVLCRECHEGAHKTARRREWNRLLAGVRREL